MTHKHKVILEDGTVHQLVETTDARICIGCSLFEMCRCKYDRKYHVDFSLCEMFGNPTDTRYELVEDDGYSLQEEIKE